MKRAASLLSGLAAVLVAATVVAQPLPRNQVVRSGNTYEDSDYGVRFVSPDGWQILQATRWGDLETTVHLGDGAIRGASPAVYYKAYYASPFRPEGAEAWLREQAELKAAARLNEGFRGYTIRPDSLVSRTINGQPALSWIADYVMAGRQYSELLTRVIGPQGYLLVFAKVPADRLDEFAARYEALVASVRLDVGAGVANPNPHVLEGRRHYAAKAYGEAFTAFAAGFEREPISASDLEVGAAAAALAGETRTALQWLQIAQLKNGGVMPRLASNPDFASLHNLPEWEALLEATAAARGPAAEVTRPALRDELEAIHENDQRYRQKLAEVEQQSGRDSREYRDLIEAVRVADAENLPKVERILEQHGWLGPEDVGPRASTTLFLVIQHADLPIQEKYLPVMREAVKAGKARAGSFALLEDRVALRNGRPQTYGSQIGYDRETDRYFVQQLDDPDHVDERRAAVGLEPLADYVKRWNISWDAEAYKKQAADSRPARP